MQRDGLRRQASYYILEEYKVTDDIEKLMLKEFGMMFKGMDVVLLNLQYGEVDEEIKEFDTSYRDRDITVFVGR